MTVRERAENCRVLYGADPIEMAEAVRVRLVASSELRPGQACLWVRGRGDSTVGMICYHPDMARDETLFRAMVAHELGHWFMDVPEYVDLVARVYYWYRRKTEKRASRFSAYYLVPIIPPEARTAAHLAELVGLYPEIAELRWRLELGESI